MSSSYDGKFGRRPSRGAQSFFESHWRSVFATRYGRRFIWGGVAMHPVIEVSSPHPCGFKGFIERRQESIWISFSMTDNLPHTRTESTVKGQCSKQRILAGDFLDLRNGFNVWFDPVVYNDIQCACRFSHYLANIGSVAVDGYGEHVTATNRFNRGFAGQWDRLLLHYIDARSFDAAYSTIDHPGSTYLSVHLLCEYNILRGGPIRRPDGLFRLGVSQLKSASGKLRS